MEEKNHIDANYEKWKEEFEGRDANKENIEKSVASRVFVVWSGYMVFVCILLVIAGAISGWNKEAWIYLASPLVVYLPAILLLPSAIRLTYIFVKWPKCPWSFAMSTVFPLRREETYIYSPQDAPSLIVEPMKVNVFNDPTIYEHPDRVV